MTWVMAGKPLYLDSGLRMACVSRMEQYMAITSSNVLTIGSLTHPQHQSLKH